MSFSCGHCDRKFQWASHLDRHVRIHPGEKLFSCTHCFARFRDAGGIKRHVKVHTLHNMKSSQFCSKESLATESVEGSVQKTQVSTCEKQYVCESCNKSFSRAYHLTRHERVHSDDRPYRCLLCSKQYRDPTNLRRHARVHNEVVMSISVPHAGVAIGVEHSSTDDADVKSHVYKIANESLTHVNAANHLGRLERIHDEDHVEGHQLDNSMCGNGFSDERLFECSLCRKRFLNAVHLQRHEEVHFGENQLQFVLSTNTAFHAGPAIEEVRTDNDEKPYVCEQCRKRFKRAETLKKHVKIHAEENPYECFHCATKYSSLQSLKNHLLIHNVPKSCDGNAVIGSLVETSEDPGECEVAVLRRRPYACDQCSKRFQQSDHLIRHKRTHSGEKPFACTLCSKKYRDPTTLRRHVQSHTDRGINDLISIKEECTQSDYPSEDPLSGRLIETDHPNTVIHAKPDFKRYVCELCGKRFRRVNQLRRHAHIHSNERPYTCTVCNKQFKDPTNLRRHLFVHIGGDEKPNEYENQPEYLLSGSTLDEANLPADGVHTNSVEKPYVCQQCHKRFLRADGLKKHLTKFHSDEKSYESVNGTVRYGDPNSLQIHPVHSGLDSLDSNAACSETFEGTDVCSQFDKVISQRRRHLCDLCSMTFKRADHLIRHKRTHSVEKPFACTLCRKRYKDPATVRRHIQLHSTPKTLYHPIIKQECVPDGVDVNEIANQIEAIHADPGMKRYVCELCGKRFRRVNQLKRHAITHSDERPYGCRVCNARFKDPTNLRRHFLVHVQCDDRPLECRMCCKRYNNLSSLRRHEDQHTPTGSQRRPHQCDQCEKTFQQNDHLKRHQLTHSGEKPYECTLCARRFGDPSTLRKHLKFHATRENPSIKQQSSEADNPSDDGQRTAVAKPHLCEQCGKRFNRIQNLTRHSKVHCGEKLYGCELCCVSFSDKGSLREHLLMHNGENSATGQRSGRAKPGTVSKTHDCEVCFKSFRWANHLIRHAVTHSAKKPYACTLCSKTYTDPTNLRRHRLTVHRDQKPHECRTCKARFVEAAQLEEHTRGGACDEGQVRLGKRLCVSLCSCGRCSSCDDGDVTVSGT